MKKDIKGSFGHAVDRVPWDKNPLYQQATEAQRQELDTAMQKIDKEADGFEHVQFYGQAVMEDIASFCSKVRDVQSGKPGVDMAAMAKEFKDVQRRMDLHVLGAEEIKRRYTEEYIPEAMRRYSASGDASGQAYVSSLEKRQQDFSDRLAVLQGTQSVALNMWFAYGGQAALETQRAVPLLKKISLKKPLRA